MLSLTSGGNVFDRGLVGIKRHVPSVFHLTWHWRAHLETTLASRPWRELDAASHTNTVYDHIAASGDRPSNNHGAAVSSTTGAMYAGCADDSIGVTRLGGHRRSKATSTKVPSKMARMILPPWSDVKRSE
jgi:hypothetical protein